MVVKITVRNNQSLLDIAMQEAGTYDALIGLMRLNNLSASDELKPGQQLLYEDGVINTDIRRYYKANNLHPATGVTPDQANDKSGISIWKVGVDFKVSE